ncbi:MAG: N-acetylmuramoyl-L-alanine amidase [Thermodesulfobacteriota bacterium]
MACASECVVSVAGRRARSTPGAPRPVRRQKECAGKATSCPGVRGALWAGSFALWFLLFCWPHSAWALNQILSIRHWVAPDHTRVVIDTGEDPAYSTEKEERRVVLDFQNTALPAHIPSLIQINKPGLERVTISPLAPSGVRVELSLPDRVQITVFKLRKVEDKPYRLVIDITLPEAAKRESEARQQVKTARKDRIVVIDPGHGGEAVGAVGRGGTFEKDIVLSIARRLQDQLNRRPGYRAFLTRDGDYYVSFRYRLMVAREYGADLFVSIHADAARNREARGTSVYCLSLGGASSEAAKILARSENLADIIGGVANGEGNSESDPILLDMFQTHSLNQSKTFGGILLKHLAAVNPLKFTEIQEAPFHVLKLPEIPSVLLETAYISNASEEKLLRNPSFQTRIAQAAAAAIGEFLPPAVATAPTVPDGKDAHRKRRDAAVNEELPPAVATAPTVPDGKDAHRKRRDAADNEELPPAAASTPDGKDGPHQSRESAVRDDQTKARVMEIRREVAQRAAAAAEKDPGERTNAGKTAVKKAAPETTTPDKDAPEKATPEKTAAPARQKTVEPHSARDAGALYRVQRGDTLAKIARKHGTSVRALLSLNRMKAGDPLYVDRVIRISGMQDRPKGKQGRALRTPGRKSAPEKPLPVVVYRVKRGDTLAKIAKLHGTTVQALTKLNRLKPGESLHVDRKLVVPGVPSRGSPAAARPKNGS